MFKNEHDNSESDTWFFLQKRNLSCTLLEKKDDQSPAVRSDPVKGILDTYKQAMGVICLF